MTPDGGPSDPGATSDARLFELARSGDTSARNELVKRHGRSLRAIAEAYDSTNAKALIKGAFALIGSVDPPGSAAAVRLTLFGLIRQAAIEAAQRAGAPQPTGLVDFAVAADSATANPDAQRALLEAFGRLTDQEQALLWFVAVEGLTPVDLAQRLPIGSVDAGATSSFRARSHLRHAYVSARAQGEGWPEECLTFAPNVSALFVDGALRDPIAAETTRTHVASCDHCQQLLAELSQISGLVMVAAAPVARPPGAPLLVASAAATELTSAVGANPAADTPGSVTPFINATSDDELPRHRAPLVVVGVVALVLVIGLAVFLTQHDSSASRQKAATVQPPAPTTTRRLTVTTSLQRTVPTVMSATTSTTHPTSTTTRAKPTTTRRRGAPSGPPAPPAAPPETQPVTTPAPVTTPPPTTAPTPKVTAKVQPVDPPGSAGAGSTRIVDVVNPGPTPAKVKVTVFNANPSSTDPLDWECGPGTGSSTVVCTSDNAIEPNHSSSITVAQAGSTEPTVDVVVNP